MKKIVILSDTHGNFSAIDKILPILKESDLVLHLGDYERDILAYKKELGSKIYSVKGNCDGGSDECVFTVENVKIMMAHGDKYGVKSSLSNLLYRAKELGVQAVFYGHTHIASVEEFDGIKLINPGCMNRFSQNSYCYAVVYESKITVKIVLF